MFKFVGKLSIAQHGCLDKQALALVDDALVGISCTFIIAGQTVAFGDIVFSLVPTPSGWPGIQILSERHPRLVVLTVEKKLLCRSEIEVVLFLLGLGTALADVLDVVKIVLCTTL